MSGHGDVLVVIRCANTRRVVSAALEAGWQWVGYTKAGHIELRWPPKDVRIHCASTPSDSNAWKVLARTIKRVSGVTTVQVANHKRSRKGRGTKDEVQVAAARRRYEREQQQAEQKRIHQERQRQQEARERAASRAVSADDDRHLREIRSLMMPGYGR